MKYLFISKLNLGKKHDKEPSDFRNEFKIRMYGMATAPFTVTEIREDTPTVVQLYYYKNLHSFKVVSFYDIPREKDSYTSLRIELTVQPEIGQTENFTSSRREILKIGNAVALAHQIDFLKIILKEKAVPYE